MEHAPTMQQIDLDEEIKTQRASNMLQLANISTDLILLSNQFKPKVRLTKRASQGSEDPQEVLISHTSSGT